MAASSAEIVREARCRLQAIFASQCFPTQRNQVNEGKYDQDPGLPRSARIGKIDSISRRRHFGSDGIRDGTFSGFRYRPKQARRSAGDGQARRQRRA